MKRSRVGSVNGPNQNKEQRASKKAKLETKKAHLADRLCGISVHEDRWACGLDSLCDVGDGEYRADLVVGVHHRDQDRLFRARLCHSFGRDAPLAVARHIRHRQPFHLLEGFQALLDGRVLDVGRNHMRQWRRGVAGRAPPLLLRFERADDGMVVRLAAACREDDFILLSADQRGNTRTSGVHSGSTRPSERVTAGRIAPVMREEWHSSCRNLRPHRRGRLVVKVDAPAMLGCTRQRRTDAGLPCLKWAGDGVDERLQDRAEHCAENVQHVNLALFVGSVRGSA